MGEGSGERKPVPEGKHGSLRLTKTGDFQRRRGEYKGGQNHEKVMTAAFALSASVVAPGKLHTEVNDPWCIIRGFECSISRRAGDQAPGRTGRAWSLAQAGENPLHLDSLPIVASRRGAR